MTPAARATLVNRTHRVVRERARSLEASRSRVRGLLLPVLLCSVPMVMFFAAIWALLDQYDLVFAELPASAHHWLLLLVWFVPVSCAMVAMVWLRRGRDETSRDSEGGQ